MPRNGERPQRDGSQAREQIAIRERHFVCPFGARVTQTRVQKCHGTIAQRQTGRGRRSYGICIKFMKTSSLKGGVRWGSEAPQGDTQFHFYYARFSAGSPVRERAYSRSPYFAAELSFTPWVCGIPIRCRSILEPVLTKRIHVGLTHKAGHWADHHRSSSMGGHAPQSRSASVKRGPRDYSSLTVVSQMTSRTPGCCLRMRVIISTSLFNSTSLCVRR